MAEAATATRQRIDLLLDILTPQWASLEEVERTIDRWDLVEQLTFIEEWPLTEQRLAELVQLAQASALTQPQATRYARLCGLVARNRPIIERLRRS